MRTDRYYRTEWANDSKGVHRASASSSKYGFRVGAELLFD